MRAVRITEFGTEPRVVEVPDPVAPPGGVVVRVEATGLCASDRFAWAGHDGDVTLPHVPGHELVGRVVTTGAGVSRVRTGDRVTTPFVCGCGTCPDCRAGRAQVCPHQRQPGFTDDGSCAELVALHHADANLVPVPDAVDAAGAALLGCRVATAHRALVGRGGLAAGERVLVLGAGGVGLAAVLIASALGAEAVVADPSSAARSRAVELGASAVVDTADGPDAVREAVGDGGARLAVEAAGRTDALDLGVRSLRRQGTLVQVGLLAREPVVPVPLMIAHELTVTGSHGMAAADYPALMGLVADGGLDPGRLVTRRTGLAGLAHALGTAPEPGEVLVALP
ncbi:alcohol dehydrogenase catalytic domain-containing protein [Pseudonocardia sp. ICBG1293]|uniref:alcohol dehydrogenase catalytic domain-containing protein n=1 Tax=Pseudonocardia sp. ICBG1293 TaxID=2844382 RepID=UPI001CCABEE7|nr:alcohol dehydrogenase catalytic domain-containing protein [Pseudonocardia sp. ICBG1293]